MGDWSYNWCNYGGASVEGLAELMFKDIKNSPSAFTISKIGSQAIFELEFVDIFLQSDDSFSFETKWGLDKSTVIALIKLLEPSYLEIEYEESGSKQAGVYFYNKSKATLVNKEASQEYWELKKREYAFEDEPLDIFDYLEPGKKETLKI